MTRHRCSTSDLDDDDHIPCALMLCAAVSVFHQLQGMLSAWQWASSWVCSAGCVVKIRGTVCIVKIRGTVCICQSSAGVFNLRCSSGMRRALHKHFLGIDCQIHVCPGTGHIVMLTAMPSIAHLPNPGNCHTRYCCQPCLASHTRSEG